jgi:hypothetical protein
MYPWSNNSSAIDDKKDAYSAADLALEYND